MTYNYLSGAAGVGVSPPAARFYSDNEVLSLLERRTQQNIMIAPQTPFEASPNESSQSPPNGAPTNDSASRVIETLFAQLRELVDYASYYWAARTDQIRARWRRRFTRLMIIGMAYLCLMAALAVATIFLIRGLAGGLTQLLGSLWAGDLATGGLILLTVWAAITVISTREQRRQWWRTWNEYE